MKNKKLKKLMTDLAAGHITQKEVDEILEKEETKREKKNIKINKKGGKTKSHKIT